MLRQRSPLTLLLSLCVASAVSAQSPAALSPASHDTACAYRECALGISPTWNGLAVVRGTDGTRVANLYFFWPRDITAALRGDINQPGADSAAAQARRAVSIRRAGATLTNLGVLTLAVAAVRAIRHGKADRTDQILGGAGMGALAISVPFQFAADGALSRAVWWHNLRFAR